MTHLQLAREECDLMTPPGGKEGFIGEGVALESLSASVPGWAARVRDRSQECFRDFRSSIGS